MPDQTRTVEIHELVYGSAARLLEPGPSDLGVIASTRDFPADIARRLASHRGFTPDSRVDGAVKYIVGVLGGRLEFTRIQMGTDHTGRAIPFARHLLIPLDKGNRWGDLVHRAATHALDPRQAMAGWITPSPRLSPATAEQPPTEALAKAIATAAVTVMQYPQTKRPVLLVHGPRASPAPAKDPFLGFVASIGDILPRSALPALVAVTHAVDLDDRLAEASVLATYPGTPLHKEMISRAGPRRPLIIDVAQAAVEGAVGPPSMFITATVHDLMAGRPGRFADLCDRFSAKPEHWPLIADVYRALGSFEAQPTLANADALVSAVRKAGGGTAGAALDRSVLRSLFVTSISDALNSLARDAAGQVEGVGRLSRIIAIDESLHERAAKEGVAAQRAGTQSVVEALAMALADVGADAIAVARRVAGDLPAGCAFVELIDSRTSGTAPDSDPRPVEFVERKRKPQRRDAAVGPRVLAERSTRSSYGGAAAVGSPWRSRLIAFVSFAPALFGIGWPVRCAYAPPPQRPDAQRASTDSEPRSSRKDFEPNAGPSSEPLQWWDAAHREALYEAIKRAKTQLIVPGFLCTVAFVLLVLNGVLTRAAFAVLQPVGGGLLATFLPTLALFALSATGGYLGYSAAPTGNGQDPVSHHDVTPSERDGEAARGRRPETRGSKDGDAANAPTERPHPVKSATEPQP